MDREIETIKTGEGGPGVRAFGPGDSTSNAHPTPVKERLHDYKPFQNPGTSRDSATNVQQHLDPVLLRQRATGDRKQ